MAAKNGRSGAKTKGQQRAREASNHERHAKERAGRTVGAGKSAAGRADKSVLADEVMTRARAEVLQAQAHQTFLRELPKLLENYLGQWVAYRAIRNWA